MTIPNRLRSTFWVRLAALCLDGVICYFIVAAAFSILLMMNAGASDLEQDMIIFRDAIQHSTTEFPTTRPQILFQRGINAFLVAYFLLEIPLQGTLGKKILRLRITNVDGSRPEAVDLFIRSLVKVIPFSMFVFGSYGSLIAIGMLASALQLVFVLSSSLALRASRRALHDQWSKTIVVSEANLKFAERKTDDQVLRPTPLQPVRHLQVSVHLIRGDNQLWTIGKKWPLELHCGCGGMFLIEEPGLYECPNCESQASVNVAAPPTPPPNNPAAT